MSYLNEQQLNLLGAGLLYRLIKNFFLLTFPEGDPP